MSIAPAIFCDPARIRPRFRPLKALGHFRALMRDKEDTEQVFHMTDCLPSRRFRAVERAFCESEQGKALMAREPWLPTILDDHKALLKLPQDSVGQAYVRFMRAEGLSAAGLVAESEKAGRPYFDDQVGWFNNRLRDTHDLVHVLTGYGRDALGEQCALGFSYGQYHAWTDGFLAWAASLELKRRVKSDAPVFGSVAQAVRAGKAATPIFAIDVTSLLAVPLETARCRMNIGTPDVYQRAHQRFRASGINPFDFMAAAA
jgi:ubiquinone biosynthesis protein COQ4